MRVDIKKTAGDPSIIITFCEQQLNGPLLCTYKL